MHINVVIAAKMEIDAKHFWLIKIAFFVCVKPIKIATKQNKNDENINQLLEMVNIPDQSTQGIANIIIVVGSMVCVIVFVTHVAFQRNYKTFSESFIFELFYHG